MKYRAEIDGLRAFAVLSVVIFHFYPFTLDLGFRGYLGVDVFFVISGFLIGRFIIYGLRNASFSFRKFYWRRVKRILPATMSTLIVTSVAAIYILAPYDLVAYFKSQLAALTFTPNIYFWRAGGYFGDLDALKPLLHFWSLGVEEQFYLIFPLTLFLVHKLFGRKSLTLAILVIAALSFVLNIFLIKIGGGNPAFFLLPARVWQFGLGCFAACIVREKMYPARNELLNVILILLALSFFVRPPSLLPDGFLVTIFTAMILVLTPTSGLAFSILSNRVSQFFGKISFSIYLLHWPVVALLNYVFVRGFSTQLAAAGLIFTFLVSYLSYRFVEVPFRCNISDKKVKQYLLSTVFVIFGMSIIGMNTKLLEFNNSKLVSNLSAQIQTNYRCPVSSYRSFGGGRACILSGAYQPEETSVVLVGNSHAQMYAPLISQKTVGQNALLVPLNSCLPTTNVNISDSCLTQAYLNFEAIKDLPKLQYIVMGLTWYGVS
ncbi:acyltransferase family protein [Microbulbifer sp. 2201CG32-9]|uniref:acyltransferase family protein n=1 Tax=Microbulbifer sp. 2201CG32-9 TaxID=3232309 RepID=UPI00345B7BAB